MQFAFIEHWLEKVTLPSRPDSVLVLEAQYDQLRAVVVSRQAGKLTASFETVSTQINYETALQEIADKVKKSGWKGQHVVMVSPAVCMTVLPLNIPHNNKLPAAQIAESMQWELETIHTQHQGLVSIGHLMQVLGFVDTEQTNTILQQQQDLMNQQVNANAFKTFGELALDADMVSRAHLEDCVTRQHWFKTDGEDLKCDWFPLTTVESDHDDYNWLVAGMQQDLLRLWQAEIGKHDWQLEAVYPVYGARYLETEEGAEPTLASDAHAVLIEMHRGLMTATLLANDAPIEIESMPVTQDTLLTAVGELIEKLDQNEQMPIRLMDCSGMHDQQLAEVVADFSAVLGREVVLETQGNNSKINWPLRNAARHFFREPQASVITPVSVHEPLPPLMQRFNVRAILAAFLVVALILLTEVGMLGVKLWHYWQSDAISEDVTRIRNEIKRINDKTAEVNAIKAEMKASKLERSRAEARLSLLTKELPERNQQLTQIMDLLQQVVSDDLVIDSITENTLLGFNFRAWSLSEESAQAFIKQFQLAIHPMNYRVKGVTVSEDTGRLGLIGYRLQFSITTLDDEEYVKRSKIRRRY